MNVILGTGCKSQSETIETSFQFPGGSDSKESACNVGDPGSLGQEDPLEKEMATHPVLLLGKFHGRRNLVDYSVRVRQELDTTERLHFTSLCC